MKDRENILKQHNSNIQISNKITPHSINDVLQFNSSLSTLSTSSNNISNLSNYKITKFQNENMIYSSKRNSKKNEEDRNYIMNKK